jgi:hypothetical protein
MTSFLVEVYRSGSDTESLRDVADRLSDEARRVSKEGTPVKYADTIFLPSDETCLHVFDADTEAAVRAVAQVVGIHVDRVVPAERVERDDVDLKSRMLGRESASGGRKPSRREK